jgi:nucleoside-diphosphate-sugar epimerase
VRILFTGASSFTGCWFVRELAGAGHEVWATFRHPAAEYEGVRRARVESLASACRAIRGCSFGDQTFLDVVQDHGPWDLLCHHAADVTDYKSPDFDVIAALANNTHRLPDVLAALRHGGCRRVLLTGSVFEQDEGVGSEGLPAFSPYGLSKGLTYQVFRYQAQRAGLHLGKFVIPNPFGPWEEPRFTAYLMRCWIAGEMAQVRTPAYVRDNIHVSLLAKAYVHFATELPEQPGLSRLGPSGYVESQGSFAGRVAGEMRGRLNVECGLNLTRQAEFDEPRIRINTDPVDADRLGWDEAEAWDEFAAYYQAQR